MQRPLHERMREKGWSEEEIQKTMNIMHSHEKVEKHIGMKKEMNLIIYWSVLLVLTVCNFLISVVLIPMLLILKPGWMELIVIIIGFVLGLLFNHLLWDIEHIEKKHHFAAAIFMPLIAIINMFIIVNIANSIEEQVQNISGVPFGVHENPFIISLLYIGAFIAPYAFSMIKYEIKSVKKIKVRKEEEL